jgi:hypothetical protein
MIFGLEPEHPLPDNWTPIEAIAVIKCLDENGELALDVISTGGVTIWEALGMLNAAAVLQKVHLRSAFAPDEGDT